MENVSFQEIPLDIRTPGQYVEIDNSLAVQGLIAQPRRILVLTQKLNTGTATAAAMVQVLSADQAVGLFGVGSLGAAMFAALKKANPSTETWAVPLDDLGAGVTATGTIVFGGTVTAAGTLELMIGGRPVRVAVASSDTPANVATNVVAAIGADTELLVTAVVDGGTAEQVNLTARHKGETGNAIDVRVNYYVGQTLPAGLTATITAMSGGTGNPDVATAIAALSDDQYQTIVMPWTDDANMDALEAELSDRFGPMRAISGHAFAAVSGTHSALSTYGNARNSPHSTVIGVNDSPTPPWEWAATLAGECEFHGATDPARPFQTLALKGMLAPPESSRFTRAERDLLLHDGISTYTVDRAGVAHIERVITTYQTNTFGLPDTSFLDLNTVWTVDEVRFQVRARIANRYPRHKLADDGTRFGPGQAIVTPRLLRGELIALFGDLEEAGLVENVTQFKEDLIVVRSESDPNRVNAVIPPDLVNQFRVFAAAVQYRL